MTELHFSWVLPALCLIWVQALYHSPMSSSFRSFEEEWCCLCRWNVLGCFSWTFLSIIHLSSSLLNEKSEKLCQGWGVVFRHLKVLVKINPKIHEPSTAFFERIEGNWIGAHLIAREKVLGMRKMVLIIEGKAGWKGSGHVPSSSWL